MFFIFGWGRQTRKDFGSVAKWHCNHCGRDDYWRLLRSTTWATLFFIPLIPYSIEKFILCPICQYGIQLDDKKFNEFRPLAEANQLLIDGKITETEHARMLESASNKEIETVKEGEIIPENNNLNFCHSCGKEIDPDAKFCKFCGNKLN